MGGRSTPIECGGRREGAAAAIAAKTGTHAIGTLEEREIARLFPLANPR
jgi:hypothetical protein